MSSTNTPTTRSGAGSIPREIKRLRAQRTNKAWTTQAGRESGGRPFDGPSLRRLLQNPLFVGQIRAGEEVVDALHEAIVDREVWDAAQALLRANGAAESRPYREPRRWDVLLAALVTCARCGRPMGHTYTSRGRRRYSSYTCQCIQKGGAAACPRARIPAAQLDEFVTSKIRAIANDPHVIAKVAKASAKLGERLPSLRAEIRDAEHDLERLLQHLAQLDAEPDSEADGHCRRAALERDRDELDQRLATLRDEVAGIEAGPLDPSELRFS